MYNIYFFTNFYYSFYDRLNQTQRVCRLTSNFVECDIYFSQPGMSARRAIYFSDVFSLYLMVDLGANRSQELLN